MNVNRNRLFVASCFALITTALALATRSSIMDDLTSNMGFDLDQLGWLTFMGIFGFPVATLIGGPMYNSLGPKKLGWIAMICHFLGITFSLLSTSFLPLIFSNFFISFGSGMVEAAYNPLVSELYPEKKSVMLNKFHVWFPGGVAIGFLLMYFTSLFDASWQLKVAIMYIPLIVYAVLFYKQEFPTITKTSANTSENIKAIFSSPLYWLMLILMMMTATTELSTTSWVQKILGQSGANPLLIGLIIFSIMAVGRYFAGPVIKKLNIVGVLLVSAIISTIALGLLSSGTGGVVYLYAVLFAVGICYFWPNMIAFVAEYFPKTGALGMSLIGGVGMLGVSLANILFIDNWLKNGKAEALAKGIPEKAAELAAGQATLDNIAVLPAILTVIFGILWLMRNKLEAMKAADGIVNH